MAFSLNKHLSGRDMGIALICVVIIGAWGVNILAKVVGRLVCGEPLHGAESGPFATIGFLVGKTSSADAFGTATGGCIAPTGGVWATIIVLAVAVTVGIVILMTKRANYLQSPKFFRKDLLAREGIARAKEVRREMGAVTTVRRGHQVRPTLAATKTLTPEDVGFYIGDSQGVAVFLSMEDAILLLGPPRSGKGFTILTSQIVESPGAVVTTSSRGDNMEATILARSHKGPVYVFDPERVTGRHTTITWSPVRGCEDGALAKKRASTLVSGTGLSGGQNQEWAGKAVDILQCLLHAAAVGNVPLAELHTWTKSPVAARRALPILESKSVLGWAPILEAVLDEDPRSRDSKWFGVASSLSALDVPDVRSCFEPAPGQKLFDPATFLAESGTLYLTAELRSSTEAASGVGVFFSMLLDDIQAVAHKMAMRSAGGRLDPPVAFILDEIANIHPWPGLPQAMAAGSGEGLQVTAVFQSRSQARDGWGESGERIIWESATRKVLLGGAADTTDLKGLSDLMDVREVREETMSRTVDQDANYSQTIREKPVISVSELRRLSEGLALLLAGRARPMVVDLIPHPQRPWAHLITESKAWHKAHPAGWDGSPGPTFTSAGRGRR